MASKTLSPRDFFRLLSLGAAIGLILGAMLSKAGVLPPWAAATLGGVITIISEAARLKDQPDGQ